MGRLIKRFKDGSLLEFGRGRKDNWCVYHFSPGEFNYAPEDRRYLRTLREIGEKYSAVEVYNDFVEIYDLTTGDIDPTVLEKIESLSEKYSDDRFKAEFVLTALYAGMIAEINWPPTQLGKRIKRLGVHQLLIEGFSPDEAADYSRNMGSGQIKNECEKRGF